jgi:5-methylcytosine-specific restriction protein A
VRDDFTCQACGFRLELNGRYVIEVHHVDPLSSGERESSLGDLVSLCPTCHRIAHLRSLPYSVEEIRGFQRSGTLRTD